MLTAAFSSRLVAFAGQVGRPPGDFKLVVFAIDSLHLATQTPGNHDTLKRTFSSKIGKNAVVCTLISSPDALPCWVGCLAGSVSPANTDERLASTFLRPNSQTVNQGRRSFQDDLDQLVQVTGGRFQYEFPPDNRDHWKDKFGQAHPPPVPRANIGQVPHDLQLDLTSGSGSVIIII